MGKHLRHIIALAIVAVGTVAQAQTWSTAQLFNLSSEAGIDVKSARIAASVSGGFHGIYHASDKVRYRRYMGGTLSGPVDVFPGTNFIANGYIAEALNGNVHVVFENWAIGYPQVGWAESSNGGVSFTSPAIISQADANTKHPLIAAFGMDASADAVMSYYNAGSPSDDKELASNRYNGSAWLGDALMESWGNSEYEVFGIGRSPVDGSVYRSFTDSGVLRMRRYNGVSWEPEIVLDNVVRNGDDMHNRQRLAINGAGQVMVIWDQGGKCYSVIYSPGVGVSSTALVTDKGSWGQAACAVGGTTLFYAAYSRDTANHVVGRTWSGGAWQAEEEISNGLPWAFTVDPMLASASDSTLYVTLEYWGNNKPQQYYNVRSPLPLGTTGTISGVVRDQYGRGVRGIGLASSGIGAAGSNTGGAYSMTLPVGTYSVSANQQFFTGQTRTNIVVSPNQTTTVDFAVSGQAPAAVASLAVTSTTQANHVSWTLPTSPQCRGAVIRYSTVSPPATASDGQLFVDQPGSPGQSFTMDHTGLTNGTRIYYAAFAYLNHLGTPYYAAGVSGNGSPAVAPDFDHDGDVDQRDFGHLQTCFSGTFVPQNDPNCQDANLDKAGSDNDVDSDDLAILLNCMSGPGVLAAPDCAG
jgi:hypothetical protein